jgi:LPXTG-motif cell wall-anchored protein
LPRRFGALMLSGALVVGVAGLAGTNPASAATATVGPIDFEDYTVGNINGQNDWTKTGLYDVEVENLSDYPDASGYGFQTKALRASNFYADGAFGGQAYSPGVSQAAGEGDDVASYFTASFDIGTTQAEHQPGLAISVSPDDGNGSRMSYLRFNDMADGVHVNFVDVTNDGGLGTATTWNPDVPIATLARATSHALRFEIAFVEGPGTDGVGNDVVKIFVDGVLKHTGTTWENYYRYDPEQVGNGNVVPTTSKLLFAARGPSVPTLLQGQGYLIDDVSLSSSTNAPAVTPPKAEGVAYDGNMKCADFDPSWNEFKIDAIPVNQPYDDPMSDLVITISNASPQTFDWASNDLDMSAVLVKGGDGGIKYSYPGAEDFSDTGLHAPEATKNYHDISHVSFCYKVGGDSQPTLDVEPVVTPQQPEAPVSPQALNPAVETTVLGETLVRGDTLPRTGTAATNTLVLAGGLGLGLGLMMLMLARRKTAVHSG